MLASAQSKGLFCECSIAQQYRCLTRINRYCAFAKKKKRTDEQVCWIQGEPALATVKFCNPYAFPLFVEVIGIEACVENKSSCDVPLEVNSSRGFDLPPSLNGSSSTLSIDLSVTPAVHGVISIKVQFLALSPTSQEFHLTVIRRAYGPVAATSFPCTVSTRRALGFQMRFQLPPRPEFRHLCRLLLARSM